MKPATRDMPDVTLLRMVAGGKAQQLRSSEYPDEFEACRLFGNEREYLLVGSPLWDQLLAKATAHEESQRNNELIEARQTIRRLTGQLHGMLSILKTHLHEGERIPDAAWKMIHGDTALTVGEDVR